MAQPPGTRAAAAIVVDSAASLPAEMARQPLLHVVPMRVTIGERTYLDGRDLAPTDFYRLLRKTPTLPSTSAPSPASFLETFSEAADEARSLLCLTVGSRFSSSFESASAAAREAAEVLPEVAISVIDSETAAGGEALVALEAWRAASRGCELEEAVSIARRVMARVAVIAFLDTLYYVWKGGRVRKIAYAATSLLRIKPIFELAQGDVRTVARPRTRRRAMSSLLEMMSDRAGSGRVHATVMHADAAGAAEDLRQRIELEFECDELFISEFTPVMGAHIGPGLVGIAFWTE